MGHPVRTRCFSHSLQGGIPILPDTALEGRYTWEVWSKPDPDHTAVRFCTGRSTRDEDAGALFADLERL